VFHLLVLELCVPPLHYGCRLARDHQARLDFKEISYLTEGMCFTYSSLNCVFRRCITDADSHGTILLLWLGYCIPEARLDFKEISYLTEGSELLEKSGPRPRVQAADCRRRVLFALSCITVDLFDGALNTQLAGV